MATADQSRLGDVKTTGFGSDGIEFRHLRAFKTVAEELNFSRAAERLYLSQPALSRQVRALENRLGCALLRRSTHEVELTPAGHALIDQAARLLDDLDAAVATARSVGGATDAAVARIWDSAAKAMAAEAGLAALRAAAEDFHAQFPVPEVTVRAVQAGGVPALVVSPEANLRPTMLFLHGGGYVTGSAFGYRHLAGAIATACRCAVLVPDYRLAPEHPFPAGLEDAMCALDWMIEEGTDAIDIVVAGDSAGAGLVMSLLLLLRREGRRQPGAAALLCPVVDRTFESVPPRSPNTTQPGPYLEELRMFTSWYLPDGGDEELVAPLSADLSGLPPLLVQAGEHDPLLDDARRLTDVAERSGVAVELDLYPSEAHDFHVFWSILPAAAAALEQLGVFVNRPRQ